MAKKKSSEISLKDELKKGNVAVGTKSVMKNIRNGKIIKVYTASNCPAQRMKDLESFSKASKFEIIPLKVPNDELGIVCKKQYSISMLGVLKE